MNTDEILKNIKNPLTDDLLKEIIYRATIPNEPYKIHYTFYNNLVNPNHNERLLNVNKQDKLKFTTALFNTWKYNMLSLKDDELKKWIDNGVYSDSIYKLLDYLKTLPSIVDPQNFYAIENNLFQAMNYDYDEVKKYGWRKTDGNYWTKVYIDDVIGKRNNYLSKIKHRIYMNVNEQDLYLLSTLFISKCYEKKVEYSFKFSTKEKREDAIVFYASDETLPKYLEILNEIKKERPDIFSRCENPPILTGRIDEKIGYGAEPTERIKKENDDLASFNTLRTKILEDAINETTREWIINNSEKFYVTHNNQQMLLGDYIVYKYAEKRYHEYLQYSGKYSKDELRSPKFQKELLQAYQGNKKWIINREGYFNDEKFQIPLPRNIENLEKEILRNIVSNDPTFLENLKTNIKEKCTQYDIDPENFSINVGQARIKDFEDKVKELAESAKQKLDNIYNDYINKIKKEQNENSLLKEFGNVYQEFVNKVSNINVSEMKETIRLYKIEITSKIKELYSNYYLKLQDLKSKDNFEQMKETLPTFEELKKLKDKYEIKSTEHFEHKIIVEKETGKQVTDSKLINNVNFAYLWKYAAQIKLFANDDEGYAFNNLTEESYNFFINEIMKQIKETGTIDSIKLFRQSQIHSLDYKYTTEIITKLFDNKVTIKKIEEILHDRGIVENNALENVQELYGDELIATRIAQEKNNEIVYGNKVK